MRSASICLVGCLLVVIDVISEDQYKFCFLAGFPRHDCLNETLCRGQTPTQDLLCAQIAHGEHSRELLKRYLNDLRGQAYTKLRGQEEAEYKESKGQEEAEHTKDQVTTKLSTIFDVGKYRAKIRKLEEIVKAFRPWLVGLDLIGDELGYPFVPFTLPKFAKFIRRHDLGVRIHGGENPQYDSVGLGLSVHMTILLLGVREIYYKVTTKLRIGHGTDLATMFDMADADLTLPQYISNSPYQHHHTPFTLPSLALP